MGAFVGSERVEFFACRRVLSEKPPTKKARCFFPLPHRLFPICGGLNPLKWHSKNMARRAWTISVSLSPDCGTSFTRIWSDTALSPEGDKCFKNTFFGCCIFKIWSAPNCRVRQSIFQQTVLEPFSNRRFFSKNKFFFKKNDEMCTRVHFFC